MAISRFEAHILTAGLVILGAPAAHGEHYPSKPIRLITAATGSGSDFVARLIAQEVSNPLGQQMVVDNRGIVAIETVAKASPDGYTLLLYGAAVWLSSFTRDNPTWDPLTDFSPITLATRQPNVLVVNPALGVKTVTELISLAKTKPGELNYASSPGGSSHLSAELFKAMAGVNITRISYKGSGQALVGVLGGQVQIMFASSGSVAPHLKSGKLTALGITSAAPSELAPGLPTVASGLPGYESVSLFGIFAPSKTPRAIIVRLNEEMARALKGGNLKDRLHSSGTEAVGSSPQELSAAVLLERKRWGKVIKDAGIRDE